LFSIEQLGAVQNALENIYEPAEMAKNPVEGKISIRPQRSH
jgi:hypothetical protein